MTALREIEERDEIACGFETIRQFNRGGSSLLMESHRREVPEDGGGRPPFVRWAHLRALEDAGHLKIMVARNAATGFITGYLFWIVELDPIYSIMIATGSPLYVAPHRRGEWLSVKMLRQSEPLLKEIGVRIVRIWGSRAHPIAPLPLRCGYEPDAESWTKEL